MATETFSGGEDEGVEDSGQIMSSSRRWVSGMIVSLTVVSFIAVVQSVRLSGSTRFVGPESTAAQDLSVFELARRMKK